MVALPTPNRRIPVRFGIPLLRNSLPVHGNRFLIWDMLRSGTVPNGKRGGKAVRSRHTEVA